MGYSRAQELASGEFVQSLEQQIMLHFQTNCYPPVPLIMIPVAIKAIELANSEEFDTEIELPDGVLWRNQSTCTAGQAIDSLYLHAWLSDDSIDEFQEL